MLRLRLIVIAMTLALPALGLESGPAVQGDRSLMTASGNVTGTVAGIDERLGLLKVRDPQDNFTTFSFKNDVPVFDAQGKKIPLHDVALKDMVRVHFDKTMNAREIHRLAVAS
jgi:hypothetical protein